MSHVITALGTAGYGRQDDNPAVWLVAGTALGFGLAVVYHLVKRRSESPLKWLLCIYVEEIACVLGFLLEEVGAISTDA